MEINKNQAIYKYLPYTWAEFSKNHMYYTVRIEDWNTKPIDDIFKSKITEEILRSIYTFEKRGGNISKFSSLSDENLEFVEPIINENFPDIIGKVNPLLFYCNNCGELKQVSINDSLKAIKCVKCGTFMKQLRYVYSCECGHAEGIKFPYDIKNKNPKFYASENNKFKFQYTEGKNKRKKEMLIKCPSCGKMLSPKNASDRINFNPYSIRAVNLIDKNLGKLLNSDSETIYIFIARWLEYITLDEYKETIKNPDLLNPTTGNTKLEVTIKQLMEKTPNLTREEALKLIKLINPEVISTSKYINIFDEIKKRLSLIDLHEKKIITAQLIEYLTLDSAKRFVQLDNAKKTSLKIGTIINETEIDETNKKFGIKNAKLISDIEIVNASYAYTRKGNDPSLQKRLKTPLKLNPFYKNGKYLAYTSKLFTEGVLIEFDRRNILEWLINNNFVDNTLDLNDEKELKLWFIKHIKPSAINNFSEIEYIENNNDLLITKLVYGLVHTLSHVLIKSSGYISGIDKDSVSEMIFANIPATFIYSTSVQGISLGALETMFTNNYYQFIDYAYKNPENCILDPICMEEQQGRCFSCLYLSEVSCSHFNKDLSRIFLYGGKLKISEKTSLEIKKGFFD